jgi:ATP-dependent DNA helicase RecQ
LFNLPGLTIHQILLKYWGYAAFRPLQEDIIRSVLEGRDTLALLPTGGGKSLTFQVPALAMDGVCLVISPLIALMKDQVDQLKKRGIPASAIYSGMHPHEIERVVSNARFGDTKLLYISPERLTTDTMRSIILRMKINLIAVDESHCISQWGYDFRPPYLRIAEIRELLPGIPVLALTATATPRVVRDIMEKLRFRNGQIFQKSFERTNLTYVVIKEEDKYNRLLKIIRKVKGSGIVYVRNRKGTKEVATFLSKEKINADYYHAGLDPQTRDRRQKAWTESHDMVMVCTNAFGMGIDKPDVRFVVHLDLPDCIESYFQEAGRAGRDEKHSWAVLLWENADVTEARQNIVTSYPEPDLIRSVYQALGNYFQIAVGNGKDEIFDFDILNFCDQYKFQPVVTFNAIRFLEKEGYLMLTEAARNPSRVFIRVDKETLYRFQVANEEYDPLIKTLLRSYTGILTDFTKVSENELGKRLGLAGRKVMEMLKYLQKQELIEYIPQTQKPQLIFPLERADVKEIVLSPENYHHRMKEASERLEAMIGYAESVSRCRSQQLLEYFGETQVKRCGKCDVCIERNKLGLNEAEFDSVAGIIKPILKEKSCTVADLVDAASPINEDKVILTLSWLLDNNKIIRVSPDKYKWK